METHLTIKHIAPYLPYGLKAVNEIRNFTVEIKGLQTDNDVIHSLGKSPIKFIKPILRPLSDIAKVFKTMEYDDKKVIMHCNCLLKEDFVFWHQDFIIQIFFKYHFDVFRLIEKGLAIDINTLKKQ